ncbi:DUF1559 family PulG-like putative transporter [Frigoriglobus tundricola]|uniref:DUF1559 domain-containing protein n=1 Tax=Frigoriglobus tundricola TaxID=2774151 RepID=A0A6M5YJV3_9BACT|nr:DUF1559 domain-containing protein [Frigoriglobus tundricola]QJW93581.1 hypothetical protein FTUN_1088 [Frigoriglobus tundricola]
MISGTVGRRGGRAALWLVVGLLVGGTVGAGAAYLIKRGKDGVSGGPRLGKAEEMDFVPADAAGFIHVRVRGLWHTEAFADFRKLVEKAGPQAKAVIDDSFVPAPSTLDRVTLVFIKTAPQMLPLGQPPKGKGPLPKGKGAFPPAAPQPPGVPFGNDFLPVPVAVDDIKAAVVIAFSAPFDAGSVRSTYLKAATQVKHGDREYWDDPGASIAAYFPSDTVMVLSNGDGMKAYLAKLGNPNGFLTTAIDHAREGSRHVVAAINFGHLGVNAAMLDGVPEEYKQAATTARTVLRAESLMIGYAIGEESKFDVRLKYKDDAGATESETALRELAKIGREKLAEPKKQMETALNGPPNVTKPRPLKDLPAALGSLFGLGSINALDEWLADPPLRTEGSELVFTPKVPSLTALYASAAAASIGTLLPAVDNVRGAATRVKDANNLKQFGLAMHAYNDAKGHFPPQDGKTAAHPKGGLSWRVHLLPYIEQDALYKQFNLDEPWDGPTNKKLIEKMPAIFQSPFVADPPNQTRYKVFSGRDTIIHPGSRTTLLDITDGTSNTILIVGGGRPVVWTQPDDIPFTGAEVPPSVLALPGQTGCNVALCDGSVRWLELSRLSPTTLKAAITRAGGETLGPDWDAAEGPRRPLNFKD